MAITVKMTKMIDMIRVVSKALFAFGLTAGAREDQNSGWTEVLHGLVDVLLVIGKPVVFVGGQV